MKRRNHRIAQYCKQTGKVSFSSEAKATRKLNKYDQIQRVYFCGDCEGFHLTSETVEETLENGAVDLEEENGLLRKYNDKLVNKIGKLKKTIGVLKEELQSIKTEN